MAAAVVTYNVCADPGETVSEGIDELIVDHPVLTRISIALLALHCANAIAQQADPLHWAFAVARRRRVFVVIEGPPS